MNRTKIEWALNPDGTLGYTWNPITGCLNGCSYCYARKLANGRLKQRYLAGGIFPVSLSLHERYPNCTVDPFYPRFWPERLRELGDAWDRRTWHKTVKGIFVCDMSDLFGIGIPEEWTRQVLNELSDTPHRFYLLTKQPQNLIKFSPFPDNCWVGVTITDNNAYYPTAFLEEKNFACVKARIKFISFEPLLEKLTPQIDALADDFKIMGINWVIIGAQTKPYKLPEFKWVEEIIEACSKANIPYFLKDNLAPIIPGHTKGDKLHQEMPEG